MYKFANYELFYRKISEFDWSCLQQGTVNEVSSLFTNVFIEFAKLCIPNKTIVVREDDKPWYDSEIRRNSRKRDRLMKTALKSGNPNDWNKYKYYRNKVNNQKKACKKVSNGAKIRNRYNQVPHLTQDTNGKVTNSQKTPQTRAKRSALSQQVTTKHI